MPQRLLADAADVVVLDILAVAVPNLQGHSLHKLDL